MHWLVCQVQFHSTYTREKHLLVIINGKSQRAVTCSSFIQSPNTGLLAWPECQAVSKNTMWVRNNRLALWLNISWRISQSNWVREYFSFVNQMCLPIFLYETGLGHVLADHITSVRKHYHRDMVLLLHFVWECGGVDERMRNTKRDSCISIPCA